MLTVQLPRVNIFPIARCDGLTYIDHFQWCISTMATVKFPFPENCFLRNAVAIFYKYFNALLFLDLDSVE